MHVEIIGASPFLLHDSTIGATPRGRAACRHRRGSGRHARTAWTVTAPQPEIDPCDDPEADEDTIIVCRRFESGERYTFERPVRADTEVTGSGAPRPPDFDESCLRTRGRENCMMFGSVPPPAIMVDFDALPETPAGSEAARLYGGPTDADVAAEADPAGDHPDLSERSLRGLDDDVIGP